MLTAFSLFSAAILMALPLVTEYSSIPDHQTMYLAEISFVPLIISLVLAIIAQWRFQYQTMLDATEFEDQLYRNRAEYNGRPDYDWQWICQLSSVQNSKKKNNDKRVFLVKASMICFLISGFIGRSPCPYFSPCPAWRSARLRLSSRQGRAAQRACAPCPAFSWKTPETPPSARPCPVP